MANWGRKTSREFASPERNGDELVPELTSATKTRVIAMFVPLLELESVPQSRIVEKQNPVIVCGSRLATCPISILRVSPCHRSRETIILVSRV